MSQAHAIRIKALEERCAAIEKTVEDICDYLAMAATDTPPYRAVERAGKWYVETLDGTRLNTEDLTQADAEKMAAELCEQIGRENA